MTPPTKCAALRFALAMLTMLALVSCGGGGGGGSRTGMGAQTVFKNNLTGPLTFQQKSNTEDALALVMSQSVGKDLGQVQTALLASMKGSGVFQSGGIAGRGNVWGVYIDGTGFTALTADPDVFGASAKAGFRSPGSAAKRAAKTRGRASEVPDSNIAYVFDALEPYRASGSDVAATDLTQAGYTVVTGTGSLSDWTSVSHAGVLVNYSHGSVTINPRTLQPDFYLETSDVPSPALDATYSKQLKVDASLMTALVMVFDSQGTPKPQRRYQFDNRFLGSANVFADKNSLMINWACESTENTIFADTLEALNNLGVYIGWSDSVEGSQSSTSILLLLDRLLAINQFSPVQTPPPAPQSWSEALFQLGSIQRPGSSDSFDQSTGSYLSNKAMIPYHAVFKDIAAPTSNLTSIIPSIVSATAGSYNGSPDLELSGFFGSTAGTATFNGSAINVLQWSSTLVKLSPPPGDGTLAVQSTYHLPSNNFKFVQMSITPPAATVALGGNVSFTVVPPPITQSGPIKYTWTVTGQVAAVLDDKIGHVGATIKTPSPTATLETTLKDTSNMAVTVEAFDANSKSLGKVSAAVTVSSAAPSVQFTIAGDWNEQLYGPLPLANGSYSYNGVLAARETLTDINGKPIDRMLGQYDLTPDPNDPNSELVNCDLATWAPVGHVLTAGETFKYGLLQDHTFNFQIPNPQGSGATDDPGNQYPGTTGTLTVTEAVGGAKGSGEFKYTFTLTNPFGGTITGSGVDTWQFYP